MVLAIVDYYQFACRQLDFIIAFLNTHVEEVAYIKMVPGYEEFGGNGVLMIMKPMKRLNGLRQTPSIWLRTLNSYLVNIACKGLKSDMCVYLFSEGGDIVILTLYVDEVLLVEKDVRARL